MTPGTFQTAPTTNEGCRLRNILIATLHEDQTRSGERKNCEAASGIVAKRRYFSRVSTKVAVPAQPTVRQKVWNLINNTCREGNEKTGWGANEKLINVYRPENTCLHSTLLGVILSFQSISESNRTTMKSASGKRPPDEAHGAPEKKLSSRSSYAWGSREKRVHTCTLLYQRKLLHCSRLKQLATLRLKNQLFSWKDLSKFAKNLPNILFNFWKFSY